MSTISILRNRLCNWSLLAAGPYLALADRGAGSWRDSTISGALLTCIQAVRKSHVSLLLQVTVEGPRGHALLRNWCIGVLVSKWLVATVEEGGGAVFGRRCITCWPLKELLDCVLARWDDIGVCLWVLDCAYLGAVARLPWPCFFRLWCLRFLLLVLALVYRS